jgi:hypothetical protein
LLLARPGEIERRVLAVLPEYFEVLVQAGNTARFMGDVPMATAYYDQAGRVRADSWIPPYDLACLRATHGAPEEALVPLDDAATRDLTSRELLDENDDLYAVRTLAGWPALVERVQTAAARAERGGS